jgi:hypothetical protein
LRTASFESWCGESLDQPAVKVSWVGGRLEFVVGGSWRQTWCSEGTSKVSCMILVREVCGWVEVLGYGLWRRS